MIWEYESLWNKCKSYIGRGQSENRDSSAFELWYLMAFELLGRAVLANVHPSLLADPMSGGDNVLYAFGFAKVKTPRSVTASTVFKRCEMVIADMTENDSKSCISLIEYRNEELHSGSAVLEDLPTQAWLAEFYRLCELMLRAQGKNLVDLFGLEEAAAATKMVEAAKQDVVSQARALIAEARKRYEQVPQDEKSAIVAAANISVDARRTRLTEVVKCPACGNEVLVFGELVSISSPRIEGDLIALDNIVLPIRLQCGACRLDLPDHAHLHAVEMGGQFTTTDYEDPMSFYQYAEFIPDVDEYGND